MVRDSKGGPAPLRDDAAAIAALLTCYDIWSATPQRDCAADLLQAMLPGAD